MGSFLIFKVLLLNFSLSELFAIFSYYFKRSDKNKKGREFLRFVVNSIKYNYSFEKEGKLTRVKIVVNSQEVTIYLRRTYSDLMVFRQIFLMKEYKPILDAFKNHNFHPNNMIDGGGNIGLTSLFFSLYFPDIKKLVIEPNMPNYELMRRNFQTNHTKKISLVNKGIWSKKTSLGAAFSDSENSTGWGFKVKEIEGGIIKGINLISLSEDYRFKVIDFLKLDIEGAEVEVFKSKVDSLAILGKVNSIAVEPHSKSFEKKLESLLTSEGFDVLITGELIFGIRKLIIPFA